MPELSEGDIARRDSPIYVNGIYHKYGDHPYGGCDGDCTFIARPLDAGKVRAALGNACLAYAAYGHTLSTEDGDLAEEAERKLLALLGLAGES